MKFSKHHIMNARFKNAVAEMKKLFNLGWDFGPALNKAASEFGVDARALYAYAALAPADLMES